MRRRERMLAGVLLVLGLNSLYLAARADASLLYFGNVGLHVAWFLYRGQGKVTFSPEQIAAWEDTRAGANSPWAPIWIAPTLPADGTVPVTATFDTPGTYVLRARADDGGLTADDEVTVTVTN